MNHATAQQSMHDHFRLHSAVRLLVAGILLAASVLLLTACSSEDGTAASSTSTTTTVQATESSDPATAESQNTQFVERRYPVYGMDCTGCEAAVSDALTRLAGVISCEASYEGEYAIVRMTDDADEAAIIERVTELGFYIEPAGE